MFCSHLEPHHAMVLLHGHVSFVHYTWGRSGRYLVGFALPRRDTISEYCITRDRAAWTLLAPLSEHSLKLWYKLFSEFLLMSDILGPPCLKPKASLLFKQPARTPNNNASFPWLAHIKVRVCVPSNSRRGLSCARIKYVNEKTVLPTTKREYVGSFNGNRSACSPSSGCRC